MTTSIASTHSWLSGAIHLSSDQQERLKWLALIVMTLDHYALIFHNTEHIFHYLSRWVLPVFAYLVVYNYCFRTGNKTRYLARLFMWAALSQPFYSMALDRDWDHLNILFSLFFGIFLIYGHELIQRHLKHQPEFSILAYMSLFLIMSSIGIKLSYFWFGLWLILACYSLVATQHLIALLPLSLSIYTLNGLSNSVLGLAGLLFIPVFFITKHIQLPVRRIPGWLFYAYYPIHLIVIYLSKINLT